MEMLPGTEISLSCRLNIAYLLFLIHLVLLLFMYSRKTELTSEIEHYFSASFHASGSHSAPRSFQHHSFHLLQTHVSLIRSVTFQFDCSKNLIVNYSLYVYKINFHSIEKLNISAQLYPQTQHSYQANSSNVILLYFCTTL